MTPPNILRKLFEKYFTPQFGYVRCFALFYSMLMTIADFAVKRGVAASTVYSWIDREQEEKNNFEVVKIGKVNLIKDKFKKKLIKQK